MTDKRTPGWNALEAGRKVLYPDGSLTPEDRAARALTDEELVAAWQRAHGAPGEYALLRAAPTPEVGRALIGRLSDDEILALLPVARQAREAGEAGR